MISKKKPDTKAYLLYDSIHMKFKNKQKNYGLRSHDSVYPWRDGVMTGRDYKWGLGVLVNFFLCLGGGYPDVFTL